jgi:hypothetical protein
VGSWNYFRCFVFAVLPIGLAGQVIAPPEFSEPQIHWKGGSFAVRTLPAALAEKDEPAGTRHVIVQFTEPLTAKLLSELESRGIHVLRYVPDEAYLAVAPVTIDGSGLPIRWIGTIPPEIKLSASLPADRANAVVEWHADVSSVRARQIVAALGMEWWESPSVAQHHLLIRATANERAALAEFDEVAYLFPAADDLVAGLPVVACESSGGESGVGQYTAHVGEGWGGPSHAAVDLKYTLGALASRLSRDAVAAEITKALAEWSKRAAITFTPGTDANASRNLNFLFAAGDHGDGYPFDGPGKVLAHTFYPAPPNAEPIAGDLHFDDEEAWSVGASVDVFSVVLHELGHALGLGHSDNPSAVMYPYYKRVLELSTEDITAIRLLYPAPGTPTGNPPVKPPDPPVDPPKITPVTLEIRTPQSGTLATAEVVLSGVASHASGIAAVTWWDDKGRSGIAIGTTAWQVPTLPVAAGETTFTVRATAISGTYAEQSVTVRWQVPTPQDRTAPQLQVTTPATTSTVVSSSSLVFKGTASDQGGIAKITWTSSNGPSGTAQGLEKWATEPIPIYQGLNRITVSALDRAGNKTSRSVTVLRP